MATEDAEPISPEEAAKELRRAHGAERRVRGSANRRGTEPQRGPHFDAWFSGMNWALWTTLITLGLLAPLWTWIGFLRMSAYEDREHYMGRGNIRGATYGWLLLICLALFALALLLGFGTLAAHKQP